MKQQIPAILLAAATLVLAVLLIDTRKEIASLQKDAAPAAEVSPQKNSAEPAQPEETADPAVAVVTAQKAEPAEPGEVDAEVVEQTLKNHQRVMSSIAKMRDNPTMNKMIEASQRGTIGALYADMIDYLQLTPDETNRSLQRPRPC